MTVIYIDGQWYDRSNAKISVFDHGLLYGDGVFEGMRVYGGKTFKLKQHIDRLYGSAFRAQFISGLIQPAMMFIGNLNYVLVAVIGGLRVASGSISLGDVQAFIQYTRQFSQPIMQVASMASLIEQSPSCKRATCFREHSSSLFVGQRPAQKVFRIHDNRHLNEAHTRTNIPQKSEV